MSALGAIYQILAEAPDHKTIRLPAKVIDELRASALLLAVAETNIRAPVQTRIHCTDTTPGSLGACECRVSRELSRALFDHGVHKGEYTRLDWNPVEKRLQPWGSVALTPLLQDCVRSAPWAVTLQAKMAQADHVNIQEARAIKAF